jgi:pyrimidine deaminase RibD-like protein
VKDGKVLGEAYRGELAPGDHAEFTLLEKKLAGKDVSGATLYTTLEPCTERNPLKQACTKWIIERKIEHVVIGTLDPNPIVRGLGELRLHQQGIKISRFNHNLMDAIVEINKDFFDLFPLDAKQKSSQKVPEIEEEILGPNGYRIGFTDDGDLVEWIPSDENPGQEDPLILRRNDTDILKTYEEFKDKFQWNRRQIMIEKAEAMKALSSQERALLDFNKRFCAELEEKYGKENLGWDDFEWGFLQGKMSALSWVMGAEWEESLDT